MKKIINIVLLILWIIFIYYMSSFNATESSNQSGVIVTFIGKLFSIKNIHILTLIIRKFAHYTEYFILGILTVNTFLSFNKKNILYMILFCVIVSITDEFHQIFVPGRSGQVIDIIIDSLGVLTSIYLLKLLHIIKYE